MGEIVEKAVDLDDILSKFGAFGSYQIQAATLLGIAFLINGMHCINFIFVAEDVPYRCQIDKCESPELSYSSPWYNTTAPVEYKNCYKYGETNITECVPMSFDSSIKEPCEKWVYEHKDSFISEFGLACQDWKRTFVGTIHSIGLMIGLLIQGQLSDKMGRKTAIILSGVAAAFFGLAKSFSRSYTVYIILELMEAIFGDNCSPAYIMSVELVDHSHRLQQHIYLCVLYAIGGLILSATAYYLRYWRDFVRAIYTPSLLFLLYIFFMDESVRWLLSKGRKKEATDILLKIAKRNKVHIEEKSLVNLRCEDINIIQKSPLKQTFASKIMIQRFCVCLIWWISCTFICFGLMINAVSLAGNMYVNFAIMAVADVPVSFLMVHVLTRYRRKKPLIASFLLAGFMCILQTMVPIDYPLLSIGLYLLGKFLATFTFGTVYMYTTELFPTYSRNFMHALCSSIGRIGSVLAPMTPLLMQYSESLPTILIGSISVFAGLVTFLVPDAASETLPDNVTQAENVGLTKLKIKTQKV